MAPAAAAVIVSPIPSLPSRHCRWSVLRRVLALYAATGALLGAVASFAIARWLGAAWSSAWRVDTSASARAVRTGC
jgi:hypothetical protein